jgi:uncharacterized membrane protein (Fun14 family)
VAIIGYALKKVLKILVIVVGMFFVGLVYLQYQQIVSVNWDKVQTKSQGAVATFANVTTQISNNIGNATGTSHPTHAFETNYYGYLYHLRFLVWACCDTE